MSNKKKINVAGLTEAAKHYDPVLRTLPYFSLAALAAALKLNIIEVSEEDVIVNKRRAAGATGPYKPGMDITYKEELMKFHESSLKPELVVSKTKDNITNYMDKKVLVMAGQKLDLKTKNHPLERMIVENEVTSHGEDVVFSLFFAERDDTTFSPMTAFTGFFPVLNTLTTAGLITLADKNLQTTGAFGSNSGDTDYTDYEKLVDFIGSAHPMLRSSQGGIPQLLCAENVIKSAREALQRKLRMHEYPSMARFMEILKEDAYCPGLVIDRHEALGTGSKIVLQKAGNMDIGFNTGASGQFMQVRNPYEDPNDVQFWIEAAYGTRVRDIHQKVFKTNEQENTALDLAGDYNI